MSATIDNPPVELDLSLTSEPVTLFERDENGLVRGVTYAYTDDGRVDWRAMLRSNDLYVKREFREEVVREYGAALDAIDLTQVKDRYLCVLLGGVNRLAHLRGIRSVRYPYVHIGEGKAVAVCEIEFVGNFETGGEPLVCSSMASATIRSVDPDFVPYLETFAENRAFVRCVKRALQINILSDIEVGGEGKKKKIGGTDGGAEEDIPATLPGGNEPHHVLADKCANPPKPLQPFTFEAVQAGAVYYVHELKSDPTTWTGFESIPPADAWTILGKIEERAKAEASGRGKSKAK